jgi:hypothetical protein
MPANVHVLYPSKIKWIISWLVLGLLMTFFLLMGITCILAGFIRLSWLGSFLIGVMVAPPLVWTYILISMCLGLAFDKPRLAIDPEGFVIQGLTSSRRRQWKDIDGDFQARFTPIGWTVIYRFTEEFQRSQRDVNKDKPPAAQEGLPNFYKMPTARLADLLNEKKRHAVEVG